MSALLTNRAGRMLVFVLTHEEYCTRLGQCGCGQSALRDMPLVPSALTLPASATVEVPDAVLAVTDVQNAVCKGDVAATTRPDPVQTSTESTSDPSEPTPATAYGASSDDSAGNTAPVVTEAPVAVGASTEADSAVAAEETAAPTSRSQADVELVPQLQPSSRARNKRTRP